MNLGQLLDTVWYGTKVRLGKYMVGDIITKFTASDEFEYTKGYELVEPYIENDVMVLAVTPDGTLYIEIV